MYKFCKTEQSVQRQRELEQGLLTMMEHQRFDEISVSDLCDRLNIPRKSFYRYFSSKDGALFALLDHTIMEFYDTGSIEGLRGGTPTGDLERFFMFWLMKKPLLDVLSKSNLSGVLIERAIANSITETTLPRRFLPQDQRPMQEQIMTFCVCGLMSMVMQWHHAGYPQSPRDMAQTAVRLVTVPLFPDIERMF